MEEKYGPAPKKQYVVKFDVSKIFKLIKSVLRKKEVKDDRRNI